MVTPHHHLTWWYTLWLTLPLAGGAIVDFFVGLVDLVFGIGQVVFDTIQAAVIWILAAAIPLIWSVIEWVIKTLGTGFGFVARSFGNVFTWVGTHLVNLWNEYEDFRRTHLAWLSTVKHWVNRVRGWVKKYWLEPHLRLVNLLQHFRQLLVPLRLLHLRFAAELDNAIVRLEGKIIRNTLTIVREVNRVGFLADLFLDPTGIFRRIPLLRSFGVAVQSLFTTWAGLASEIRPFSATVPGTSSAQRAPWSAFREQLRGERPARTGELGAYGDGLHDLLTRIRDEMSGGGGG